MANRLAKFPVGLFTSIMGLCGLSLAYQRFEQVFGLCFGISENLLIISYAVFAMVSAVYFFKLVKYTQQVVDELINSLEVFLCQN